MIALIIATIGFWSSVQAESLESRYIHSLASARTSAQVEALKSSFEQLKVAQTACTIQLQERSVPGACYEAALLHGRLNPNRSPQAKEQELRKLDFLCAKAAEGLRLQLRHTNYAALSPSCIKAVHEAEAIRAYREENDESLSFDWSEN